VTNKDKYRELCSKEKSIPIFSKDWWMDGVCGEDNWDVALVEKNGEIVASMPYYFIMNKGSMSIKQPMLTQTNGIHFTYNTVNIGKYNKRLSLEKEIINAIVDELEGKILADYNQSFRYSFTNWLPFYWRGFSQTTRYTYVIENICDLDSVFSNFDSGLRNEIKKADKKLQVLEDLSIEEFYNINKKTYMRQNMKMPYSLEFMENVDLKCKENNSSKIFYAIDEYQNIHAAIYIVYDNNSAYYLMGGIDPEYRSSNATALLIWKAIQFSANVSKSFDFEGSMIESIESFFRSFGGKQKQYFNISKKYRQDNLIKIIIKDIYLNSPKLRKIYKFIRK
jgi:hypothetical protein